jgi:hypothetical protein
VTETRQQAVRQMLAKYPGLARAVASQKIAPFQQQ